MIGVNINILVFIIDVNGKIKIFRLNNLGMFCLWVVYLKCNDIGRLKEKEGRDIVGKYKLK